VKEPTPHKRRKKSKKRANELKKNIEAAKYLDENKSASEKRMRTITTATTTTTTTITTTTSSSRNYSPPYGDLVKLNTKHLIIDSVGESFLEELVQYYLDLLQTSAAVYETNGDYALGIFSSSWCRFLDQASRKLCETDDNKVALDSGKWLCHESCWTQASKKSIETGKPVDIECHGGLHIYAIPIRAGNEIVGSINFGYGNPPTDPQELQIIADRYKVSADQLRRWAEAYPPRPPLVIESSKTRLEHSAKLIGAVISKRIQFDNLQRKFIYSASHELRTPISVIIQSINNLMKYRQKLSEEDQHKLIEVLSRNALLMNQLIDGLLLISSIDQAKVTLNWINYRPLEILEGVLRELEPLQKVKEITIEYDVNKNFQLYGDPKRISQIFQILIHNAIKFSDNNTKVRIKAIDHYTGKYNEKNVEGILFEFKDEGRGIKEDDIPHLFQRFFRAEDVSNMPGIGLGLSIARELTELHQGGINVESTYGMGSTFFVFLPRLTSPPSLT
jgi:signal transduction histidine kinase